MKGSASTCDRLNGPTGCCAVSNKMQREEQTLRGCAQVYREAPYLKGRRMWLLDLEASGDEELFTGEPKGSLIQDECILEICCPALCLKIKRNFSHFCSNRNITV